MMYDVPTHSHIVCSGVLGGYSPTLYYFTVAQQYPRPFSSSRCLHILFSAYLENF